MMLSVSGGKSNSPDGAAPIEPATAPVFAEEPDYAQYPEAMAGFTGFDLQHVIRWTLERAMRVRIGQRDLYKTSVALLPSGQLLATPCYRDEEASSGSRSMAPVTRAGRGSKS